MTAATRWTDELAAWAIPQAILDAAPRNPYAFPGSVIRTAAVDPRTTPTGRAVTERLEPGDRLLDVGCGAGRIASAFVAEQAVVGVEPRLNLAEEARQRGIDVTCGRWPEAADQVGTAPVCLSTHVLYDVAEPVPFLRGLHDAAERRVVIEVTRAHPWVPVGPLYQLVHNIDRPLGPTSGLLAQVIAEAVGVAPRVEEWTRPGGIYGDVEALLDHQRQMLCIDAADPRSGDLDAAVLRRATTLPDGRVQLAAVDQATLWWDTDGRA